jgi:hypothetical protein
VIHIRLGIVGDQGGEELGEGRHDVTIGGGVSGASFAGGGERPAVIDVIIAAWTPTAELDPVSWTPGLSCSPAASQVLLERVG